MSDRAWFDEETRRQKYNNESDKRPRALKLQNDSGLEGLDFGKLFGKRKRIDRQTEERQKDNIFERAQTIVQCPG